jgi:hypothetical protein
LQIFKSHYIHTEFETHKHRDVDTYILPSIMRVPASIDPDRGVLLSTTGGAYDEDDDDEDDDEDANENEEEEEDEEEAFPYDDDPPFPGGL